MMRIPDIGLIDSRRIQLHMAWEGYRRSGHLLVWWDGHGLGAAAPADDSGLSLFGPALARLLHIDVDAAATLILGGGLLAALAFGLVGWLRFATTRAGRLLGVGAYIIFAWLTLLFGDEYSVATSLTLGLTPWLLLFATRRAGSAAWPALLLGTGVAVGVGQLLRAFAGAQVVALALVLALTTRAGWGRRGLLVGALALGLLVPRLAMRAVIAHRDAYLAQVVPDYQPPTGAHPFWHLVYMGFAFLSNDHGIRYLDTVVWERVHAIDPGAIYVSDRYEKVARGLVFDLVRRDPMFVIKSESAKAGLLGFYFLVFANVGLAAAVARRKGWQLDLAFVIGLGAAALPGLMVIPDFRYILGFTTLSALFGLTSLDAALGAGWPTTLLAPSRAGPRAPSEPSSAGQPAQVPL